MSYRERARIAAIKKLKQDLIDIMQVCLCLMGLVGFIGGVLWYNHYLRYDSGIEAGDY